MNALALKDTPITDFTEESLAKAVCVMADRAMATTHLLLPSFELTSQNQPSDKTIYHALNTILIELDNIQALVDDYATMVEKSEQTSKALDLVTKHTAKTTKKPL